MFNNVIAIEGTDGSGKGTQVERLYENLIEYKSKEEIYMIGFPSYNSFFGKQIGKMLNDGTINQLDPKSIALWYAIDREKRCKEFKEGLSIDNPYIIMNRSTFSNMVYQMGRYSNMDDAIEIGKWIYDMELHNLNIIIPQLIFILDINQEIYQETINTKGDREYLSGKKLDSNESNISLIKNTIDIYKNFELYFSKIFPNWKSRYKVVHINCVDENGKMRTEESIAKNIFNYVMLSELSEQFQKFFINRYDYMDYKNFFEHPIISNTGESVTINIIPKDVNNDGIY